MKKNGIIAALIIFTSFLFSQDKSTEFHIGFLIPKAAKTGFIGGINLGRTIDENISWAVEFNYYGKSYKKETAVAEYDEGSGTVQETLTEIENSITMLPVYFKLIFNTPVSSKLDMRIGGGIGYEVLWNKENNYIDHVHKTRFYHGFTWQIGLGASTQLSRASDLFIDLIYHNGSPSRSEGETIEGLPIRKEVNMSGIIFRIGIRIFSIGF
jgi:hypothetical protein